MLPEHSSLANQSNHSNGSNGHGNALKPTSKISTIVNFRSDAAESPTDIAESDSLHDSAQPHRGRFISFQDNFAEAPYRRGRRLHGLQFPLHPLQLFGWIVLVLFACGSFLVLVPAFSVQLQEPLYGLLTGLYIVHTVSHLFALLTDPADSELRRVHRNDRIVPEFDRKKHSHVIENGRCHLCNIRTSSQRTKHCSVCNKCVGKFDHHCKWLNHCIGGRNYVAFLMCVVSAVIATLVILGAALAQIVLYHVNPKWLSFWKATEEVSVNATTEAVTAFPEALNQTFDTLLSNDTVIGNATAFLADVVGTMAPNENDTSSLTEDPIATAIESGIGLHDTVFLVFVGFLGVLAAVTAGLLLHLCFFHIYISFLGLTTYEYIRNHRQNAQTHVPATAQRNGVPPKSDDPSKRQKDIYFCSSLKNPDLGAGDASRPTTLHCCENSREFHQTAVKTYYMCSMLEQEDRSGHLVEPPSSKTFHCCSQFARHRKIRKSGPILPTVVSEIESSTTRSYMQFTEQCTFCTFRMKSPPKGGDAAVSVQDKRCCLKTITKHHRWRRKWNCCASVPDSPDVPNDIIASIESAYNGPSAGNFIKQSSIGANAKSPPRSRLIRPWPLARIRQMLRAIGRYRRPRCRHTTPTTPSVKQNQIRPIAASFSDSSDSLETILPTSIIRDNGAPPALPPPTRRKMPNPTDLDELAETLGFSHIPLQRMPTNNSIYRRHRRKHFLRTRSPTLSPIHESGLSNPTSPQPCRHSTANCSPIVVNKICGDSLLGNGTASTSASSSNDTFRG